MIRRLIILLLIVGCVKGGTGIYISPGIQMSVVPDPMYGDGVLRWDDIPIGLGVGMNRSNGKSIMRIKAYTWLFSCITIDYKIKKRVHNISLIPVLPIFPDS